MAETWGNAFTSQYGDEPNGEWGRRLSSYSESQIVDGYQKACDDNLDFCPNLSVLIGYITGSSEEQLILNQIERQSKSWQQIQAEPIIDKGEGARYLDSPEALKAREIGTPESNPNYFQELFR